MPRRNFKNDIGKRPQSKKKKFVSPKEYEQQAYYDEHGYDEEKDEYPIFGFIYRTVTNKKNKTEPSDIAIEMFGSSYVSYELYTKGEYDEISN